MSKEHIDDGSWIGNKTVLDKNYGNSEHRQEVLADMEANGMGETAKQVAAAHGVTYTPPTNATLGGVNIDEVDAKYKAIEDNIKNSAESMMKLQQDRTDFEINKIEQQKEQAKKDLEKEKTAAYTDYQKQINPYGVNAEQMAEQGMSGTGYAESSKVRMYSDFQNRVAIAKQSYDQAVVSYNNAMTEARLQNSTVLAQLAFDTLQKSLELSLQGLQYKNELLIQAEERNYNRAWNEEQRKYERTIYEEEKKYNREQDAVSVALQKTSFGDYSALEALGWKIDYDKINYEKNSTEWAKKLELAEISAKYGDFEPLRNLGIVVSPEYEEAFNRSLQNTDTNWPFGDSETEPETTNPVDLHTVVSTQFYNGPINKDALKGAFKTTDNNGIRYQPDNINGVPLESAGFTTCVASENLDGEKRITKQNVWKRRDNDSLWVWSGEANDYVEYNENEVKTPTENTIVSTPYYYGSVNEDALKGTFRTTDANRVMYQPDNVDGDYLEWTGDYYEFDVEQKYGVDRWKTETVQVKIWKTKNGKKKYYWNGNENTYIEIKDNQYNLDTSNIHWDKHT